MNIGIVTTWFERGAAYVSRQYRAVLEKEHNVFIYARGGEEMAIGDPRWDDARVTWAKGTQKNIATHINARHFRKWLESNSIETVFFNEQHWWEPVLLCNRMGVKTGAYIDYYTEETIPLFGAYDFLICNTRRHYLAFDWHPQAFYIPWGTDTELFRPRKSGLAEPGMLTFFHSCGWSPRRKGTDLVLQAFSAVRGPARLIIHSQADLCAEMPEQKGLIEELVKKKRLICRMETVPAPGLYHLGDVYVYPSRLEGIGLTLAEALACGLPIITSDQPPMNEFLHEGCGKGVAISRLFARSDGYYWPQCMVDLESMIHLFQGSVDSVDGVPHVKKAARLFAEEKLSWTKNAEPAPAIIAGASVRQDTEKGQAESAVRQYHEKQWITGRPLATIRHRFFQGIGQIAGINNL